jgi:endonuclease YncB( thermonuclease family)
MAAPFKPRYTVIHGQYRIHRADNPRQGPQPDGDTVRFEPNNLQLLNTLPRFSGRPPDIRSLGINVRYECIDTLETHFEQAHQNSAFGFAARDKNLAMLGYTNVVFLPDDPNIVATVDTDPLPGFVIANGIEANGRLLGLTYTGQPPAGDGERIFVDENILDQSVNAKLVQAGLAYVEPYDTMPISLINHMRTIIGTARKGGIGIFTAEGVGVGKAATIASLDDAQGLVMWPKLFRRLTTFFHTGMLGLAGFDAWVRQDPVKRDDTLRLPDGEKANMHDTYEISGNQLSLRYNPEDLIIAPDPAP